jgi:hypothetical protein
MILANVIYNFIVMDTVITIVNYDHSVITIVNYDHSVITIVNDDHSVITIVNYDPKTFIVQATDSLFISETFAQVEYLWGRSSQRPPIERSNEKVL